MKADLDEADEPLMIWTALILRATAGAGGSLAGRFSDRLLKSVKKRSPPNSRTTSWMDLLYSFFWTTSLTVALRASCENESSFFDPELEGVREIGDEHNV